MITGNSNSVSPASDGGPQGAPPSGGSAISTVSSARRALTAQERTEVQRDVPADAVETKGGASYVRGFYVFDELNRILGPDGWGSETRSIAWPIPLEVYEKNRKDGSVSTNFRAVCQATVRVFLAARPEIFHEGSACGSGDSPLAGDAAHQAIGEAETDATKRAARLFGRRLGLALYDKEQRYISDQLEPGVVHYGDQRGVELGRAPTPWLETYLGKARKVDGADPAHLAAVEAELASRTDRKADEAPKAHAVDAKAALADLDAPPAKDPRVFWYGVNAGKPLEKAPTPILVKYLEKLSTVGGEPGVHTEAVEAEIEKRLKNERER